MKKMKNTPHQTRRGIRAIPYILILCCLSGFVVVAFALDENADPEPAGKKALEDPEMHRKAKQMHELRMLIREQEDLMEERRKILRTLGRTKGVVDLPGEVSTISLLADRVKLLNVRQTEIELEIIMAQGQIDAFIKFDSDQLRLLAAGMDLPGNTIKSLYPKFLEAKRQLVVAEEGAEEGNDTALTRQRVIVESLKNDIQQGVVALRHVLKAHLEILKVQLKYAQAKSKEAHTELLERELDLADFHDAKRDYESDLENLEKLKKRHFRLKTQQ